ncbi:hypothetical protein Areg01_89190 [Actinoplanes regularis]|nr:hypothetical protein Areg01_89190 [Actinoplanes regularis]
MDAAPAPTVEVTRGPGASWLRLVRLMATTSPGIEGSFNNRVAGARLWKP